MNSRLIVDFVSFQERRKRKRFSDFDSDRTRESKQTNDDSYMKAWPGNGRRQRNSHDDDEFAAGAPRWLCPMHNVMSRYEYIAHMFLIIFYVPNSSHQS